MAQVANPRKGFNFRITVINAAGAILNNFLVQEVSLPETSVDVVEHGDTNHIVKTGGMKKYGMLKIKKLCPADLTSGLDDFVWSWINGIQNENLGGGLTPIAYWRTIRIEQLAPNGLTPIAIHTYEECWPTRVNGIDLNRMQSNNVIEDIEFSVNRMQRTP